MSDEINWDEALESNEFVTLKTDVEKKIVIQNWILERRPKDSRIAPGEIEFVADCIEDDGETVEKKFTTTSKRLKAKLRPLCEGKDPSVAIKLSILRVGEQFNTQYSVKLL